MQRAQFPTLGRAPIVEGLIDLRVHPAKPASVEQLSQLDSQLTATYPVKKDIKSFQAAIKIGADSAQQVTSSEQLIGYRYESPEIPFVLQARIDGITVSRLAPYTDWEELLAETKRLWELYSAIMGDMIIARVATRFINKIHFPGPNIDFDEYLTGGPKIPKQLPQGLIEFLTRSVVPCDDHKALLVLTQSFETSPPNSATLPVLIDIDVFHEGAYDSRDAQFWQTLENLRSLKNKTFFAAITEKTLDLLK